MVARGPGRPSVISAKLVRELEVLVRDGNYIETAAASVGLSKTTIYKWLRRGRREIDRVAVDPGHRRILKNERLHVQFVNAIARARAGFEVGSLDIINRAAKEDWKAAAWRLERLNPSRYGSIDTIIGDVMVTDEEKSVLTDDERALRIQSLLQRVRHKREEVTSGIGAADGD